MATDRQTPCLYYIGDCMCFKAGKPIMFITASIVISTIGK